MITSTVLVYILFGAGFPLLIFGADILVKGASALARRLRVSDLVIGLTIVAFGTSTPELFVNIVSSVQQEPSIAVGNIIGSNIFNILIILGICAVIFPLSVTVGTVYKEIPLCFLASLIVGIMGNDGLIDKGPSSVLTRIDGLVMIAFFIVFLYHIFELIRSQKGTLELVHQKGYRTRKAILLIASGFVMLIIGSRFVVDGAVRIAGALGVDQSVIALTIVACGTSIPELATSAVAAARKKTDIAVGNIVGSNIFNVLFILGASSIICPIPLVPERDDISIAVSVVASFLLFIMMFTGRKYYLLERWEGIVFILLYTGFIYYLLAYM
jgi:cation:H+ antiporter